MKIIFQRVKYIQPTYQFYLIGLIFITIFFSSFLYSPAINNTKQIFLYLASLAFSIGFTIWCWPAIKKFWEHSIGRGLILVFHLFILLFSAVLARNIVASAIGLPPQDFDISVSFMVLLLYIPVWAIIMSIIVGIFSLLLYIFALMARLFKRPFKKTTIFLGHSFGAFTILIFTATAFDFASENEKLIHPLVRWIAFIGDYQTAGIYPGFTATERIRLHDNGVISIATIENGAVHIHIKNYGK